MSNRYYWHSKISEVKFRQIVRCFAEDKTAAGTAEEVGLDRKSVTNIFLKIRRRILETTQKNKFFFPLHEIRTRNSFFIGESESECKRFSKKYKSNIFLVMSKDGLIKSIIIYAESDTTFDEIQQNFALLKNQVIQDFELFELLNNPLRVKCWEPQMYNQPYIRNYSGNLLLYFFWRVKKFKGTSWEKFILHLKETEWRFNRTVSNKKITQALTDNEKFNVISKDIYDELLRIIKTNPL